MKFKSLQELFYPYMQYVKSAQIPKNNLHKIYWEVANWVANPNLWHFHTWKLCIYKRKSWKLLANYKLKSMMTQLKSVCNQNTFSMIISLIVNSDSSLWNQTTKDFVVLLKRSDQNIYEIPSHKSLCWKPIKTTMLLRHSFVTAISKSQKHGCIDRSWETSQKKQNGSSMLICPLFLQLKYTPKNFIDQVFTSEESWASHSKQLDLPPTISCKKSCTKGIEPARAVARKKLH